MGAKTILIIDDQKFDRVILSRVLSKKIDCKILEASGSDEAFALIENESIHIILIDVDMPGMSGDEIVLKIREKRAPEELPIIMVSGDSRASVVVKCLLSGANDYIEKPVNFDVAVTRIINHLKLSDAIHDKLNLKELAAINAMITTYHHEINNPLTIAKMELHKLKKISADASSFAALGDSLDRISEVVHKIQEVGHRKSVLFEAYSGQEKMVKVKHEPSGS